MSIAINIEFIFSNRKAPSHPVYREMKIHFVKIPQVQRNEKRLSRWFPISVPLFLAFLIYSSNLKIAVICSENVECFSLFCFIFIIFLLGNGILNANKIKNKADFLLKENAKMVMTVAHTHSVFNGKHSEYAATYRKKKIHLYFAIRPSEEHEFSRCSKINFSCRFSYRFIAIFISYGVFNVCMCMWFIRFLHKIFECDVLYCLYSCRAQLKWSKVYSCEIMIENRANQKPNWSRLCYEQWTASAGIE